MNLIFSAWSWEGSFLYNCFHLAVMTLSFLSFFLINFWRDRSHAIFFQHREWVVNVKYLCKFTHISPPFCQCDRLGDFHWSFGSPLVHIPFPEIKPIIHFSTILRFLKENSEKFGELMFFCQRERISGCQ